MINKTMKLTLRFLSHPDSGLITREVLMVDGGWTLA